MADAKQIADWIVRYSWNDLGAPVDPMSLEKLIYYAQWLHLVLHDAPLFPDEILAWQKGPVVPSVWQHYSAFGWASIIPGDDEDASALPSGVESFLKQVVGFFGRYTAVLLSQATHLERPWADARDGVPPDRASGNVIAQMTMKRYYEDLTNDGETALSRHDLLGVTSEPRWSSLYVAGISARRMTKHPLYDAALAKKFAELLSPSPVLGEDFYAPPRDKELVEFPRGTDIDRIIAREH